MIVAPPSLESRHRCPGRLRGPGARCRPEWSRGRRFRDSRLSPDSEKRGVARLVINRAPGCAPNHAAEAVLRTKFHEDHVIAISVHQSNTGRVGLHAARVFELSLDQLLEVAWS